MSDQADKSLDAEILKYLEELQLSNDEAKVYHRLLTQEHSTPLALSRLLRIPRTRIYRILERLMEKGYITEVVEGYGSKYRAVSYERIKHLIKDKEIQLKQMKESANSLFALLKQLKTANASSSKILHYSGVTGLKQVTYNTLKARDIFRIYEVDLLHSVVDQKFAEEMRIEFSKLDVQFRQLTNATKFDDYTNIAAHVDQWEVRHIPRDILDVKFEIQIYNDVTAMYEYTRDDIFIVEIHNDWLAQMQKQLYDSVWANAVPMKKIGRRGKAVIEK